MNQQDTTTKTYGLLAMAENEVEAARTIYLNALDAYAQDRTPEARIAVNTAKRNLDSVRQSYREARTALMTHVAQRMAEGRGS